MIRSRVLCCGMSSRIVALRCFLVTRSSLRQLTNEGLSALVFMLADDRRDPVHIEIMCPADGLADLVQVVDDGVAALHAEPPDGNSSGVQMIGGVRPAERQIASMVPRIVAFATCLQFHVRR